jgi:delta1-piperideine-2-carboxylate reductase
MSPLRDDVTLSLDDIYELACDVLISNGFSEAHCASIARVIWRCQRDECQSHGLYRLLACVRTLRAGKVSPDGVPAISHPSSAILRADARGGYSLLSIDIGLLSLVEKALDTGIAAFVINGCCHFSALWPEVEDVARHGLAALCMLPSHSFVAPQPGAPSLCSALTPLPLPGPGQKVFRTSSTSRLVSRHRGSDQLARSA